MILGTALQAKAKRRKPVLAVSARSQAAQPVPYIIEPQHNVGNPNNGQINTLPEPGSPAWFKMRTALMAYFGKDPGKYYPANMKNRDKRIQKDIKEGNKLIRNYIIIPGVTLATLATVFGLGYKLGRKSKESSTGRVDTTEISKEETKNKWIPLQLDVEGRVLNDLSQEALRGAAGTVRAKPSTVALAYLITLGVNTFGPRVPEEIESDGLNHLGSVANFINANKDNLQKANVDIPKAIQIGIKESEDHGDNYKIFGSALLKAVGLPN